MIYRSMTNDEEDDYYASLVGEAESIYDRAYLACELAEGALTHAKANAARKWCYNHGIREGQQYVASFFDSDARVVFVRIDFRSDKPVVLRNVNKKGRIAKTENHYQWEMVKLLKPIV